MTTSLVYATQWGCINDVWRCKLLLGDERKEVAFEAGHSLSIKVEEDRFCTGYSHITQLHGHRLVEGVVTMPDIVEDRIRKPVRGLPDEGHLSLLCAMHRRQVHS